MVLVFIGIGFLLFVAGSEALLRGGTGISRAFGLPPPFIALIVAGFALSAPGLFVALEAASRGEADIALGATIGGAIATMLLVFGAGAILQPIPASPRTVFRDGGTLLVASVALVGAALSGVVSRAAGICFLVAWAAYLVLVFVTDWRRPSQRSAAEANAQLRNEEFGETFSFFLIIFGAICLFFGARFMIASAFDIAGTLRIPVRFAALVLIGCAQAVPGLVAAARVPIRGQTSSISTHLIASSIFGILFVLGITASIYSLQVPLGLAAVDGPVMIGSALLLLGCLISGWRVTKVQGAILSAGYAVYLLVLLWRSGPHFFG